MIPATVRMAIDICELARTEETRAGTLGIYKADSKQERGAVEADFDIMF